MYLYVKLSEIVKLIKLSDEENSRNLYIYIYIKR